MCPGVSRVFSRQIHRFFSVTELEVEEFWRGFPNQNPPFVWKCRFCFCFFFGGGKKFIKGGGWGVGGCMLPVMVLCLGSICVPCC